MNQTNTVSAPRTKTYEITMTALMAAVTCILAPLSIPIGPVPISFTNLAIYLSLYLLGWKKGTISYLIYLLLGLVGLPVFSGFTGGPAKLAGPTGGYIIGFIDYCEEKSCGNFSQSDIMHGRNSGSRRCGFGKYRRADGSRDSRRSG